MEKYTLDVILFFIFIFGGLAFWIVGYIYLKQLIMEDEYSDVKELEKEK